MNREFKPDEFTKMAESKVIVVGNDLVVVEPDFDLFWRRTLVKKRLMDEEVSTDEAERRCLEEVPN